MSFYDLCIAWNWEHDADFVALLSAAAHARGLTTLQITPNNLESLYPSLVSAEITCYAFLNRAADTDHRFLAVVEWARRLNTVSINPLARELRSADKATMHLEFIASGLHTPYTIILPPYDEQTDLPPIDLAPLGGSFAIKPAMGGGGQGVVLEATCLEQVSAARRQFPRDKYLLQAHVDPARIDDRPAWFRVLYCAGQVYPCWWPPQTRIYTPVTAAEEARLGLAPLRTITTQIAGVCRLHLFSTEIALTADGHFLAVDYVNDQIDLRLQSKAIDGVPDAIIHDIAERLSTLATR